MKKIFTTLFCITLSAWAVPGLSMTIVADPSDREVFGSGGVGTGPGDVNLEDFGVGDTTDPGNPGRRGLLKFPLSGLPGTIQNAILKLTIIQSRKDQSPATGGTIDDVPPFANPGLGSTRVIHIADPGAFGAVSYGAPSIGNDPGVLIPAGIEPGSVVSINVTKAVQQALRAGSTFVTFRIQTETETDRDGLNDVWFFASANNSDPATRPIIEVNPPIADIVISVFCPNKAMIGQSLGMSIKVKVANVGDVATGSFFVDIILSTDTTAPIEEAIYSPTFHEDVLLLGGRESVSNVNPGEVKNVTLFGSNQIPSDTPTGILYIGVVADPGTVVTEATEDNNLDFCPIKIVE